MKLIFTCLLSLMTFMSYGQTTQNQLFAQCLFEISDRAEMESIEASIRQNPNVQMVRLDWETQRAFIITQNISTLSESDFSSWFESYGSTVHCIQIGVYGVDPMEQYPFTNCQDQ